jgi:hypothetical protein
MTLELASPGSHSAACMTSCLSFVNGTAVMGPSYHLEQISLSSSIVCHKSSSKTTIAGYAKQNHK